MVGDIAEQAASHGFRLIESQRVDELEGSAHRMVHMASGAKLLLLRNSDENKAFAITFKTPAADNTGVFHILEHTVLCGSDPFPVKEPFVDLLKGSMQTFLNAMTFPDKTMYPVASTNDQDLMNLMDVYMDAVFHPRLYHTPAIFQQEGWHYEVGEDDEGAPQLTYNGVVFNEMKGALSDPDSVLYDTLSAALFPNTTYRFESGGEPEAIVDLTYEAFLEQHRRHYRPDNSYIVLYGDLDIERVLGFLDEEYLAPLAATGACTGEAIAIAHQAPVVSMGVTREMCTTPENACAACGFVVGEASARERLIAADILVDALLGSNEAPLKRAILDARIADDCMAYLEDSVAQPFVVVSVKGSRPGTVQKLANIVEDTCGRLIEEGIDPALIEASLSHAEFVMREHDMGYADGVVYAMTAMSGWLYDDDAALSYLRYEDVFADLRAKLATGYFEELARSIFITNDHYAQVEVVPVEGDGDAALRKRLVAVQERMGSLELEEVQRAEADLRVAQLAADSPQALLTLPRLRVDQIGEAPTRHPFGLEPRDGLEVLRHEVPSHGIAYPYLYFDLGCLTFDELPYAALLAMLLGKLDTAHRSAAQLDRDVHAQLGNLGFFCEVHEQMKGDGFAAKFVVATSALSAHAADAATIVSEIVRTTDLADQEKMRDILVQRRVAMEQAFASAGHTTALRRAASYHIPAACVREALGGVDFYLFLKDLLEHFDERAAACSAKLAEVAHRLFSEGNCLLSFTGATNDLTRYLGAAEPFAAHACPQRLVVPEPQDKREGLIVPTDVSYTALSASLASVGGAYGGIWPLISRALTYGYLWQEVRVLGGAYGTGFSVSATGTASFHSYRDPHLDETVARFAGSAAWLADLSVQPEEFAGYVVSSVAGMDAPLKARERVRKQDAMFFSGYTQDMRAEVRAQLRAAQEGEVRAQAATVEALVNAGHLCSVGGRSLLASSDEGLTLVDLVG